MGTDPSTYQRLWAPWRHDYVSGRSAETEKPRPTPKLPPGADADCFLCIGAADSGMRENLVVHRGPHALTVLNRYPYNNGHLLVAPLRHVARLDQADREETIAIHDTITEMTGHLESILRCEGFNIGLNLGRAAGAGVPGHLHWHIVPRWGGDHNFMPTVAATRTIPHSLDALWELLTAALNGSS
jgi:ATP adenylyltransferase